jgi:hypothetical protein
VLSPTASSPPPSPRRSLYVEGIDKGRQIDQGLIDQLILTGRDQSPQLRLPWVERFPELAARRRRAEGGNGGEAALPAPAPTPPTRCQAAAAGMAVGDASRAVSSPGAMGVIALQEAGGAGGEEEEEEAAAAALSDCETEYETAYHDAEAGPPTGSTMVPHDDQGGVRGGGAAAAAAEHAAITTEQRGSGRDHHHSPGEFAGGLLALLDARSVY